MGLQRWLSAFIAVFLCVSLPKESGKKLWRGANSEAWVWDGPDLLNGFAWSEGEKSKLCKLVWGLSYIMFCIKVMLGYLRLTQEWRKWNTSHWGQVSIGNQSAMLLFEDASICTWQVNWNLYSLRKRFFPFFTWQVNWNLDCFCRSFHYGMPLCTYHT